MKIKSKELYCLINNGILKENTKINVYRDNVYITQIIFNGYDFNWKNGELTSGIFFDPLCYFEITEEPKEIEKLGYFNLCKDNEDNDLELTYTGVADTFDEVYEKINELIDVVKELKKENK